LPRKPRLNAELKERMGAQLPLAFARPEDPTIGATLTAVRLVDGTATIDEALLHGRSEVERGIRWTLSSPEEAAAGGVTYYVAWVAMKGAEGAVGYQGVTVSRLVIDRERRVGWKDLPQQVNAMGDAAAGGVDLDGLPADLRHALHRLLVEKGHGAWERAPAAFREAFLAALGDAG
jgi:hypothetical protein